MIAEIAKREFPQQWPEFINELGNHWFQNTASKTKVYCLDSSYYRTTISVIRFRFFSQICLLVLEYICEDSVDSNFNTSLPTQRKDEIIAGLQSSLPSVLPVMYTWMESLVQDSMSQHDTSSSVLLAASLSSLSRILLVTQPEPLCHDSHNFAHVATGSITKLFMPLNSTLQLLLLCVCGR